MYAIVDVKDKQFKVRENDTIYVPYHADAEAGDSLSFDRVLLFSDGDGEVTLGSPTVEGASVSARVVDQVKGDKVIVFKKKRRKRYRVKRGHRQQYTKVEIESLEGNGAIPDADASEDASDADESADDAPSDADAAEETDADAPAESDAETDDENDDA